MLLARAPVVGVLSAARLEQAYGISLASSDLEVLMRHRALLFGVLGGFVVYAPLFPVYQVAAMVMAGISMVGFVVLALRVGGVNRALSRVLVAAGAGIAVLLVAAVSKGLVEGQADPRVGLLAGLERAG